MLDTSFNTVDIIEHFDSIIWTDRYNSYGEFELYLPMYYGALEAYPNDYYIWNEKSDHLMIIENRHIETDVSDGDHLVVTGRSLEAILDRRIVWSKTSVDGTMQAGIKKLITDAFIAPTDNNRKLSNFVFVDSTDSVITALTLTQDYLGDNIYDVVATLAADNVIGFQIILTTDFKFQFKLYAGKDRSYAQSANPYVVFSNAFENLLTSDYSNNKALLKSVALVGGSGERLDQVFNSKADPNIPNSGLPRRELYVDASDLSYSDTDTTQTLAQYKAKLATRGATTLTDYVEKNTFAASIQTTGSFEYKTDYFLGDIVQLETKYGSSGSARITEIIFSEDASGETTVPSFEVI